MSSQHHILPEETLQLYGASPIYPSLLQNENETNHGNEEKTPIGISINDWEIQSQGDSSIANEQETEELTLALQAASLSPQTKSESSCKSKPKRLCPPEIVFIESYVSVKFQNVELLRFDASSALLEWAQAHQDLDRDDHCSSGVTNTDSSSNRGVSVIKTKDADLWEQKRTFKVNSSDISSSCFSSNAKKIMNTNLITGTSADEGSKVEVIGTSNEFNFDWTYSTPYTGSIYPKSKSKSKSISNQQSHWRAQPISGIQSKLHLLTDTTQPILYFHEITLYEDDLHDNGKVSLTLKMRIMPTCMFFLCRLYVRVDHVLIRCRDTRIFHEFSDSSSSSLSSISPQIFETNSNHLSSPPLRIYRDVTWREAKWDELKGLGLPQDIRMWMDKNETIRGQMMPTVPKSMSTGASKSFALQEPMDQQKQQQRLHSLLNKVPTISLPNDLSAFSFLEI